MISSSTIRDQDSSRLTGGDEAQCLTPAGPQIVLAPILPHHQHHELGSSSLKFLQFMYIALVSAARCWDFRHCLIFCLKSASLFLPYLLPALTSGGWQKELWQSLVRGWWPSHKLRLQCAGAAPFLLCLHGNLCAAPERFLPSDQWTALHSFDALFDCYPRPSGFKEVSKM